MGYRRPAKTYRLTFEDMPGFEVTVTSCPLGQVLGLLSMVKEDGKGFDTHDVARLDELFATFGACLKEWNLETEGGEPVPATVDGLKGQDLEFVLELVMAWLEAVVNVPAPLKQKSSSGDQSLEGFIPMVAA